MAKPLPSEDRSLFDRVLTKPVKRDALLKAVQELSAAPTPPRREDRVAATTAPASLEGRHVLLVDDNSVNLKLGERQLTRLGLRVTQAVNGLEALAQLRLQRFDAVLMDCQMPEMDGYEATRQLRTPESGVLDPRVPVIAVTANALAGDRERCLAAGMDDYLAKPLDPKALAAMLGKLLGQHAGRDDTRGRVVNIKSGR
jgi:CheY-like chemotaxis protein